MVRFTLAILLVCVAVSIAAQIPLKKKTGYPFVYHTSIAGETERTRNIIRPVSKRQSSVTETVVLSGGMSDASYFAEIEIGTPSQTFTVDVDTGSTTLVIVGSGCFLNTGGSCGHVPGDNGYNEGQSSTAENVRCPPYQCSGCNGTLCLTEEQYGDGSAGSGWLVEDVVTVGNITAKTFISNLNMEEEGQSGNTITNNQEDGIMGLAYSSLGDGFPGFFESAVTASNGELQNEFSMCFADEGGILYLGGKDSAHYDGDIKYTPIIEEAWYVVNMPSVSVGSNVIQTVPHTPTIVDSGTTLLILESTVANNVLNALYGECTGTTGPTILCGETNIFNVPSGQCLLFNANELESLPKIGFTFPDAENAGETFTVEIEGRDYIWFQQAPASSSYEYCGFLGIEEAQNITILGDSFMKAFYNVFDRQNSRVGFAASKDCGTNFIIKPKSNVLWIIIGCAIAGTIVIFAVIITCVVCRTRRHHHHGGHQYVAVEAQHHHH